MESSCALNVFKKIVQNIHFWKALDHAVSNMHNILQNNRYVIKKNYNVQISFYWLFVYK